MPPTEDTAPPPAPTPNDANNNDNDGDDDQVTILPAREALIPLYRALYDYEPTQQDDLKLTAREILFILVVREDGWSLGLSLHGTVGFLPSSYVEQIADPEKYDCTKARLVHVPRDHVLKDFKLTGGSPCVISKVTPGGVAERCGVQDGDIIIEINSRPSATKSTESAKKLFKAAIGEHVSMCLLNQHTLFKCAERLNTVSKRPSNLNMV